MDKKERYDKLDLIDKKRFAHICPDFVVELQSESDSLSHLKEKMEEYISNGCRLGWLIAPELKKVFVYKPGISIAEISFETLLSGKDVLPGFLLDLKSIF